MKTMKIQTKRRGNLLSARKSIVEQTRLRQGFERKLYKQMVGYFSSTGRQASREIQSGRLQLKDIEQRLSQILLPHYRAVIESFANRFMFTKQENQWERIIRNYISTQGGQKITRISGTTRRKINKIISDGQVEGLGVDRIAKNIRTQMSEPFTRYRSALIARTETHNASSYTNQAVAESYEVPMKKRWVSTNDDRTRSHHSAMNGVEVDLEADFEVPYKGVTYKMKHAGDPRGGPANVINCRCVILYVEPDDFVIDENTPSDEPLPTVPPKPTATVSLIDLAAVVKVVKRGRNLSKDYNDRINSNTTEVQKSVINKLDKPNIITQEGKKGYYRDSDRRVVSDLEGDTLVHEYGHYVDYQTGKANFFGGRDAWSETNGDFRAAFNADAQKLGLLATDKALVDSKLTELKNLLFTREEFEEVVTRGRNKGAIKRGVRLKFNVESASGISDIIDGMVKGRFFTEFYCWGHGKNYYSRVNTDVLEAFANLFVVIGKGGQAYDTAKRLFPNMIREMEKRLIELERS